MLHKASTAFILGLVISLFAWGCSAPDLTGPATNEPISFNELGECRDAGGTPTVEVINGRNVWYCTQEGDPTF